MGMSLNKYYESITFSLVRQNENQTKVKIRTSHILYPPELEEVYRILWNEIDRQIFLDKSLD